MSSSVIDSTVAATDSSVAGEGVEGSGSHHLRCLIGGDAVDAYRSLKLLRHCFGWWSGGSSRRSKLRRNLGSLSRLAIRLRVKDAIARFPGYWSKAKIDAFTVKRLKRSIFREWKLMSISFIKRTQDEGLRDLLRKKGKADESRRFLEEDEREKDDSNRSQLLSSRSFLIRLGVGSLGRLGKAWRAWFEAMAQNKEQRFQRGKFVRKKRLESQKVFFDAWEKSTHFIYRRVSSKGVGNWGAAASHSSSHPLQEQNARVMMNYLNSVGKASMESSFTSKHFGADYFKISADVSRGKISEIIDSISDDYSRAGTAGIDDL